MISKAYLDGSQAAIMRDITGNSFMELTESIMIDLEESYKEYLESTKETLAEMFVMEKIDEEKEKKLGGNRQNLVEKLGQAIINIFNKINDFFKKIIDELKGKASGDEKKLAYLAKKDPKVADEVARLIKEGNFTLRDAKDFKDLDKVYDDIMKSMEDPNTLKAKWRRAVEKVNEKKGTIFAVTAVAGALLYLVEFRPKVIKANNDLYTGAKESHDEMAKAYDAVKKKVEAQGGDFEADYGRVQAKLAISRERAGLYAQAAGQNESAFQKLQSGVARLLDKFGGKNATANYHAGMQANANTVKAKEQKKKDDERQEARLRSQDAQDIRDKSQMAKERREADVRAKERNLRLRDQEEKERRDDARQQAKEQRDDARQQAKEQRDRKNRIEDEKNKEERNKFKAYYDQRRKLAAQEDYEKEKRERLAAQDDYEKENGKKKSN